MNWFLRFLPSFCFFLMAAACLAQEIETTILFDAADSLWPEREAPHDVVEVKREPLFKNFPFFRLYPGDRLVTAIPKPIGKEMMDGETRGYFVETGKKFYKIAVEADGRTLSAWGISTPCLLLDWEITIPNATAIFKAEHSETSTLLTPDQVLAIRQAVDTEFPKLPVRTYYAGPLPVPALAGPPSHRFAVFREYVFDPLSMRVMECETRIGPSICRAGSKTIVQGPPYVREEEFKGERDPFPGEINPPPPAPPVDAETAKRKKAEYDEMMRFRALVKKTAN